MDKIISENSLFSLHIREDAWNDVKLYREDYKQIIKIRENDCIPYFHKSPQIGYRDHIIKYLKKVCTKRSLTYCTLHLSVYLLDIFMDNHVIVSDRLLLAANVCLKLAAKIEENLNSIPKFSDLNYESKVSYSLVDYKSLEIVILEFFNWYIMFPTAPHYTHYFLQAVLTTTDLKTSGKSARYLILNILKTINEFLDKIIDDIHYMQFCKPSELACAIISIARSRLNLSPWTEQLTQISNYLEKDFQSTKNAIIDPLSLQCDCRSRNVFPVNI